MFLMQLQMLMNQNQELLVQIIDGKDLFAEEQKSYLSVTTLFINNKRNFFVCL